MLSEILEAAAPTKRTQRSDRTPGLSISQLFPCPYRLRIVHDGKFWAEEITPQQYYNMDDGWWQEEQSVRRLAKAGVSVENRQRRVYIGKSRVPGSYDGDFVLGEIRYLWEHKAYDQNADAVQFLQMWGMNKLPAQKAQTNGYMLGGGLEWCDFFVKVKNNNTYLDLPYQIDRPFIDEIVAWCDEIRLNNWRPEPKECKWCSLCGVGCFGEVQDFSWIATASESEAVEKWVKGKQFRDIGEAMQEEADAVLIGVRDAHGHFIQKGLIGEKDALILPGMEIRKIVSHVLTIDRSLILQHFGPEGLMKVGREDIRVQYRHKPV